MLYVMKFPSHQKKTESNFPVEANVVMRRLEHKPVNMDAIKLKQ